MQYKVTIKEDGTQQDVVIVEATDSKDATYRAYMNSDKVWGGEDAYTYDVEPLNLVPMIKVSEVERLAMIAHTLTLAVDHCYNFLNMELTCGKTELLQCAVLMPLTGNPAVWNEYDLGILQPLFDMGQSLSHIYDANRQAAFDAYFEYILNTYEG